MHIHGLGAKVAWEKLREAHTMGGIQGMSLALSKMVNFDMGEDDVMEGLVRFASISRAIQDLLPKDKTIPFPQLEVVYIIKSLPKTAMM